MKFVTTTLSVSKSGPVDAAGSVDVEFCNQGADDCLINSRLVPSGGTWSITGFPGEENTTIYTINFLTESNPLVVITRRVCLPNSKK